MNLASALIISFDALVSFGLLILRIGRSSYKKEQASFVSVPGLSPKVLVIVPVRGVDYQMELNIKSLQQQSYQNYRLLSVADSRNDPALEIIEKCGVDHILSDAECSGCSGKVKAIYSALTRFRDYDIYVIADSDIRANREWLKNLIMPLFNEEYAVSTTFPKFYPESGFWSTFKMYWGMIGESMMESQITRFVWGGSMAFRNNFLDDHDLEEFSHAISDDIAILRAAKRKGLKVAYVKNAEVNVHSPDDFNTFIEWSNRQTALSIYGSRKIFLYGMVYYASASFMITSILFLTLFGYYIQLVLLIPLIVIAYLNNRNAPVKRKAFIIYNIFLYFFYMYNLLSGYMKKEITWRGRIYNLK